MDRTDGKPPPIGILDLDRYPLLDAAGRAGVLARARRSGG